MEAFAWYYLIGLSLAWFVLDQRWIRKGELSKAKTEQYLALPPVAKLSVLLFMAPLMPVLCIMNCWGGLQE